MITHIEPSEQDKELATLCKQLYNTYTSVEQLEKECAYLALNYCLNDMKPKQQSLLKPSRLAQYDSMTIDQQVKYSNDNPNFFREPQIWEYNSQQSRTKSENKSNLHWLLVWEKMLTDDSEAVNKLQEIINLYQDSKVRKIQEMFK